MATPQMQPDPLLAAPEPQRWKLPLRIAFRFLFLYFALFSLSTQILGGLVPIPGLDFPDLADTPPSHALFSWTAAHIFHIGAPLLFIETGSGDRTVDWVLVFCLLAISAVGAAFWSALDRRRANYIRLHKWFHLGLRFVVGSQFLIYGLGKLVPMQMPFPTLAKLVEPFGDFSPFSVLWSSIGSAPAYEMFAGAAEVCGALLLFFPRTALLGAFVCLADATEVFTLNMTYDVPVKLFSFHLVLMSLVLLAPEMRRLLTFFFTDRPTAPSAHPKLFATPRANRIAVAVQVVFALYLAAMVGIEVRKDWYQYGGGSPKSPLYGIWNVDTASQESKTWKRVLFDRPTQATFQRPDESLVNFGCAVDTKAGAVDLTKPADPKWKAHFNAQRAGGQLTLDGQMDGAPLRLQLHLQDRNKLMLISRGFHWIQERPFGR